MFEAFPELQQPSLGMSGMETDGRCECFVTFGLGQDILNHNVAETFKDEPIHLAHHAGLRQG